MNLHSSQASKVLWRISVIFSFWVTILPGAPLSDAALKGCGTLLAAAGNYLAITGENRDLQTVTGKTNNARVNANYHIKFEPDGFYTADGSLAVKRDGNLVSVSFVGFPQAHAHLFPSQGSALQANSLADKVSPGRNPGYFLVRESTYKGNIYSHNAHIYGPGFGTQTYPGILRAGHSANNVTASGFIPGSNRAVFIDHDGKMHVLNVEARQWESSGTFPNLKTGNLSTVQMATGQKVTVFANDLGVTIFDSTNFSTPPTHFELNVSDVTTRIAVASNAAVAAFIKSGTIHIVDFTKRTPQLVPIKFNDSLDLSYVAKIHVNANGNLILAERMFLKDDHYRKGFMIYNRTTMQWTVSNISLICDVESKHNLSNDQLFETEQGWAFLQFTHDKQNKTAISFWHLTPEGETQLSETSNVVKIRWWNFFPGHNELVIATHNLFNPKKHSSDEGYGFLHLYFRDPDNDSPRLSPVSPDGFHYYRPTPVRPVLAN